MGTYLFAKPLLRKNYIFAYLMVIAQQWVDMLGIS
jgi:hypothetical protein